MRTQPSEISKGRCRQPLLASSSWWQIMTVSRPSRVALLTAVQTTVVAVLSVTCAAAGSRCVCAGSRCVQVPGWQRTSSAGLATNEQQGAPGLAAARQRASRMQASGQAGSSTGSEVESAASPGFLRDPSTKAGRQAGRAAHPHLQVQRAALGAGGQIPANLDRLPDIHDAREACGRQPGEPASRGHGWAGCSAVCAWPA